MLPREIIYLSLSYSITAILIYIGLLSILVKSAKIELKDKFYNEKIAEYKQQKKSLTLEQEKLNIQVTGISLLYETTRDISKTLDEAEALTLLKIKLKQFVEFDDCFLLNSEERDKFEEVIFYHLPLVIEGKVFAYLAIKNLNIKGLTLDHLYIIVNQFALILKKIRLYNQLQELAITDGLTHVFSRRYLMERFTEEYNRSLKFDHKLSFLMLDIDHFKDCNDKFGHLVGDIVLANVADEIKKNIRQVDFVGRFGGEEFAVVLPETDKPGAELSAERIRVAIKNRMIKAYDEEISVTMSIGIATYPDDTDKPDKIIDRADWSLYRAKQTGRDRVCTYGVYK
jgi:diguanylate cyclase (GGDEF)-like protein